MTEIESEAIGTRLTRIEGKIERFVDSSKAAIDNLREVQAADRKLLNRLADIVEGLKIVNAARWPFKEVMYAILGSLTIFTAVMAGANFWLKSSIDPITAVIQSSIDKLDETNRRQWTYVEETRKMAQDNAIELHRRSLVIEANRKFIEDVRDRAINRYWETAVRTN